MDRKKKIYFGILLIVIFLVSTMYFSYAFFTSKTEGSGKLNIVAGNLDYKLESNDLENNKIIVEADSVKVFNVDITSLNKIVSKYELYYKITDGEDDKVVVGYTNNYDESVGTINANNKKTVEVFVNNTSNSSVTIEFGIIGGLSNNPLTLTEGSSLVLDEAGPDVDIRVETVDGKTYAYVEAYDELSGANYVNDGQNKYLLPNEIEPMKIMALNHSKGTSDAWYIDLTNYEEVFYGHTVTVDVNTTENRQKAIDEGYDLVVLNEASWTVYPTHAASLFDVGINLITVGDDTNSIKLIDGDYVRYTDSTISWIREPAVDNIFAKRTNGTTSSTNIGRNFIHFIDGVEVLYKATVENDGAVYDEAGYYNENGVSWIHAQSAPRPNTTTDIGVFLEASFDLITKKNMAKVEITESGDYTFTAVDHAGNKVTETIHIDV